MAITVFSKNYASSTFCLNELVKIHECIMRKGRLVWPIFYDVEPSEVRHQKDHYEQALSMHIKNLRADEDQIHSWKLALHEVSNISGDHFNPRDGSRIIITTRDEQLLVAHGVESRYDMEVFNVEESLELLSWNAFRNHQVDPRYKDVLNRAVTYAQGLPLALEVIGSNLCGKTINEWESALDTYKLSPHKGIQQVLRVSYEDLEEVEKEIFLDIACLFNGEHLEYVKYMVEAIHDFKNLSYSIGVLVNKHLVKIEKCRWNCIQMHDLIRDMGRKIVHEESPNNPGERSRLWFHRDIVDVLERNTGTNKVRMIGHYNWSECIEVNWDGEAFKSMKELKILIFKNVKFSEDPKYLPESLKVLKWRGYPSSCFPSNFCPKKLVVLDMGYSCLSSLETIKTLDNLGILSLVGCEYVKEIPDLSNLRNLKEFSLMRCKNLIGIHDSVGYLPKLEILNVGCCFQLKTFPRAIKLPSLRQLILSYCSSMNCFPKILARMKMEEVCFDDTRIEKLPWLICNLSVLKLLDIVHFEESVIEIPNSIFLLPEILMIRVDSGGGKRISCNSKEGQEHAIWSKPCPNRVKFKLAGCNISDDFLRTDLSRFMNMMGYLNLSGNDFTILPAWMKECHFLETLFLNECRHLREVEGIPPSIRRLEATNCVSLSLESKSIILSEELHGAPGRYNYKYICVPSKSIPKWFDHRSKGASISFWFRNSFPTLCLCLLLKPADVESEFCSCDVRVDINEEPAFYCRLLSPFYDLPYHLADDHLVVFSIEEDPEVDPIPELKGKPLHVEDRWYHAELCAESHISDKASAIEEMGMYVIKQLSEMEDITFTNPYHQTLDSTWGNQAEQVGTRMEEKEVAVNKKRRLMGDDNFASSSTAFICTKRAGNCAINQDDNEALEIINNNPGNSIEADERRSLLLKINQELQQQKVGLDLNTTLVKMLPDMVHGCDAFRNQCMCIEFQQQENVTSTHVEPVSESFEETRKAKGKEIVIYDDTIIE